MSEVAPKNVIEALLFASAEPVEHAAMQLHLDSRGEPLRTNVGSVAGLQRLLQMQPMSAHVVSTAYVCGRVEGDSVPERPHPRGLFVNVYEESKWEAERLWAGQATLLRPGIIVGDTVTGRCTSFFGWYVLMQAVHLLSRLTGGANHQGTALCNHLRFTRIQDRRSRR